MAALRKGCTGKPPQNSGYSYGEESPPPHTTLTVHVTCHNHQFLEIDIREDKIFKTYAHRRLGGGRPPAPTRRAEAHVRRALLPCADLQVV